MKLPFRHDATDERTRGQAMVEFALILPLMILLLVLAIDFGRVFFGNIALANAARIGANEVAFNPDAWVAPGNATLQGIYRQQVVDDMNAIGCQAPGKAVGTPWVVADIPDPTFVDAVGTADAHEVGDYAVVQLNCEFTFLTPLVGAIVANPLPVSTVAKFPIKGGEIAGVPVVGQPPGAGCLDSIVPNMIGMSVSGARLAWTGAGFSATSFTPLTGFDTETVLSQTTSPPSAPFDCVVNTATVIVTTTIAGCTPPDKTVPNLVGLTVAQARSQWTTAGFDAGTFSPASGSDTDIVTAQTTTPASTPGDCRPPTTTISVTHSTPAPLMCTMPQLTGQKVNTAQTTFTTAGFTGSFTITRPPAGNYTVSSQSLVGGQSFPCTSSVTVGGS